MGSETKKTRVCIMFPADPAGAIPGGIDTFIRGTLRWAPDDLEFYLIGATSNPIERPVRQWSTCNVGGKNFNFYPLIILDNPGVQTRIPTSFIFMLSLLMHPEHKQADVLEFHGIEASLAVFASGRPKTAVIHQDMQILRNRDSDIRWRYAPWVYFGLERMLIPRFQNIFCVRENAVKDYKRRFHKVANRFRFTPTWVDTEVFKPAQEYDLKVKRQNLRAEFGFSENDKVLITVGRLDTQKNPRLLVEAFRQFAETNTDVQLLMVGEGQLRNELEGLIEAHGLGRRIVLCGLRNPADVAKYLQGADAFVLSSAYEGMPMCVLEALGCGIPVVSTDVGEVKRALHSGINGEVVNDHDPSTMAVAISRCLDKVDNYRGDPCVSAVSDFHPKKVLQSIYRNYRELANLR